MVKNPPANAEESGDAGSIPGLGRSPRKGNGNSLQYSCLRNSMDRGTWRATAPSVAKSQTQLSTGHTRACGFPEYYFRKESKVYFAQPSTNTQSSLKQ